MARNIYAGDILIPVNETKELKDLTAPGSDLRIWHIGGKGDCIDQNGLAPPKSYCRQKYDEIIKERPLPSFNYPNLRALQNRSIKLHYLTLYFSRLQND